MQTFLNLDSSDEEIILSSENDSVIQSLNKRVKYLIIYGPRKSGKTSIANNFSKVFETNLINKLPKDLDIKKDTYLDLNNLPTKDENFFHFLQQARSTKQQVVLTNLSLASGGTYKCEVSAEAPSFRTKFAKQDMVVVVLPTKAEIIGVQPKYQVGDTVNVTCYSYR